jgi:hypothetical protein
VAGHQVGDDRGRARGRDVVGDQHVEARTMPIAPLSVDSALAARKVPFCKASPRPMGA